MYYSGIDCNSQVSQCLVKTFVLLRSLSLIGSTGEPSLSISSIPISTFGTEVRVTFQCISISLAFVKVGLPETIHRG